MLKISASKHDTIMLDASKLEAPFRPIPGFWVLAKMPRPAMILAARTAAFRARQQIMEEQGIVLSKDPEEAGHTLLAHPEIQAAGEEAFTVALAVAGFTDWGGIVGPDDKPLKVTPENVRAAMQNQAVFDFIDRKYVAVALAVDEEKNASSPSRNTTSRRAARTAKAATKPTEKAAQTAHTS